MSSGNSSLDGVSSSETLGRTYSVSNSERERVRDNIPTRDYDGLKSQCDKAMHELQVLRRQHTDTVRRCEHTMKELEYYRGQHHAAMAQLESAAHESSTLRTKYGELVSDLRSSQEGENGNSDALNQLYLTTVSKYETLKEDYESLRKRYDDLIASHSSAVDKLELAQEEVGRVKTQCDEVAQERNIALRERNGLKQQCTAAIRQWDIALREKKEYEEALAKVQQQHEETVKEVNQAMAVKIKFNKDLKRLTDERNAAMQEYNLIMSERDTVHKEMEKLTEDLAHAQKKNKVIENEAKELIEEKKTLSYQIKTLQIEITSALQDRDKALKECNDLRQKFGEFKEESQRDSHKARYDSSYRDWDSGRKDHRETQSSSMDLFGKCQKERMDNLDQANLEIERLNKQVDKLQAELTEALQEAEVCKRRRDWAFSERDKIVLERESIRTLSDRMRKERDRAIKDLAEALRDSDDIKKQKNETSKQLKVLKEKMEAHLEKENQLVQLQSSLGHNYSHDSAIDTDMQECESEMLSIDINGLSSTEDLGVVLAGGRDDPHFPNDSGIYVRSITKGSVADGKLKPNDCIVRVNNVDCSNVSKRFVLETMKSSGNTAVMVVRRRRLYTTQLQLNKYDHGISLESGIYISKISPGSLAAKEGNLAVGDRVVSINNKTVEGLSSTREAMNLLNEANDLLLITTLKSSTSSVSCKQSMASTQTGEEQAAPQVRSPKDHSKLEKKRNRNSSPITYEQERDNAIAELDNVIESYHPGRGTIRRRPKSSSHDKNGGTWPKASYGTVIEPGTGTMLHTRKNKERVPLPVMLHNTNYTFPHCCEPSSSQRNNASADYTSKSEDKNLRDKKESLALSLLKEIQRSGNLGNKEMFEQCAKWLGRPEGATGGNHSKIHTQLYGPLSYPYHPHTHRHSPPYHDPSRSFALEPVYPQYHHSLSPSVDLHFKTRSHAPSHHQHVSEDGEHHPASFHSGYEGGTFPRKENRIRMPSTTSVASKNSGGKVSSSSIEKSSERGSPMPYYTVELVSSAMGQIKTSSLTDHYYWTHKLPRGAIRKIEIEKSVEPLGIQISCVSVETGGVFVSSVTENSLASRIGLLVGDQLLEICGINMRSATYDLAANVLRQCGSNITMLVQYNPDKYHESEGTASSSSGDKTRSGSPTPCNSPGTLRKSPPPNHPALASLNQHSFFPSSFSEDARYLRMETHRCSNLGISLVGGNAVGIYVHSVQPGSVAYNSGLRTGDRILEYNGTDLRQATAEEAAYELAKPADKVTVLAQYCIDRYNEIKDKPGDSFYIKAMFDRLGDTADGLQLRFRKDDILYVDNTMYNGVPGSWRASLVDDNGIRLNQYGIIPSKYKVEEEMVVRRSLGDLEGEARRATRRSFFRRKKHQRSDSKELASFSNFSLGSYSDSGMLNEETSLASYQKVTKLNYTALRPVLVVGPLSDQVVEKLLQDFPDKFVRCGPEMMQCSQAAMEKGIADSIFVDYRKKGNFFECTSFSAIKDMDKNIHSVLDISLGSVERLHRQYIYPIVLLIRFKSAKQIKEVKDTRYSLDKVTAKVAKEMYEHALKLESEYKHCISAVIQAAGVNIAYMCTQIKAAVDSEQSKTLWVPYNQ